ncbi:MAG: hypothetical protein JNM14_13560 [Ferruginibacter sp.]|nr:hypothetical protein [Ferruginibacter sp.]
MKKGYIHIVLLLAVVVLYSCSGGKRKMPSLQETYSKKDKKPFGADIAYRQIEAMYQSNVIQDKKQNFRETWVNISDTGSLYICIAQRLFVTEEEVEAMLEYVNAGNSLFISAGMIDEQLLDEIGCSAVYTSPALEDMMGQMQATAVTSTVQPGFKYSYYYYPFQNFFTAIDTANTRILGYNDEKKPNSIVYFHGKGKLYLQCEPRAYSNYFLLRDNNYQYLKNTVAFTDTRPEHIYWDDYYSKLFSRRNSKKSFSTFSEIMKHPPLKAAFWLSLALIILYILFGGKRVQRIIRQLKPNENTTVTFTETIGRLYLQKKDNKNIADKMITYFNEYIRNTYFLNTNHINDDFITMLGRKSGVEKERVDSLYRTIVATQNSSVVNDYQLLSLQDQIQRFYTNTGKKQ